MDRILRLRQDMMNANSYHEYSNAASALDRDCGLDDYKGDSNSPYFNLAVLNSRIEQYTRLREAGDISGLMFYLRSHLMRGGFGISDSRLWAHTHIGTKTCLYRYVNEVNRQGSENRAGPWYCLTVLSLRAADASKQLRMPTSARPPANTRPRGGV